jgi:hypothetical protein
VSLEHVHVAVPGVCKVSGAVGAYVVPIGLCLVCSDRLVPAEESLASLAPETPVHGRISTVSEQCGLGIELTITFKAGISVIVRVYGEKSIRHLCRLGALGVIRP